MTPVSDELVTMESISKETSITCLLREGGRTRKRARQPWRQNGEDVAVEDVRGTGPKVADDVQIFFLGFSEADINIGRILADATQGEYRQTDEDLATVIQALSGYF